MCTTKLWLSYLPETWRSNMCFINVWKRTNIFIYSSSKDSDTVIITSVHQKYWEWCVYNWALSDCSDAHWGIQPSGLLTTQLFPSPGKWGTIGLLCLWDRVMFLSFGSYSSSSHFHLSQYSNGLECPGGNSGTRLPPILDASWFGVTIYLSYRWQRSGMRICTPRYFIVL